MSASGPLERPFLSWYTSSEWSVDERTGAVARLKERERRPSDRPGKHKTVWDWEVFGTDAIVRGTAQNQLAARRKARDVALKLPDDPEKDPADE